MDLPIPNRFLSQEEILEVYKELHIRIRALLESPLGRVDYSLRQFDPRETPPFEIKDVGKIIGKMDALKILLYSLDVDLSTEIIVLEKRLKEKQRRKD